MTHEGWKNYETWCVALWLDNDQGMYNEIREYVKHSEWSELSEAAYALAGWLELAVRISMPGIEAPWSDLLTAAFGEVDWGEIAHHQLADETFEGVEVENDQG